MVRSNVFVVGYCLVFSHRTYYHFTLLILINYLTLTHLSTSLSIDLIHPSGDFETLLLDNTGKIEGVSFDQAMDYDDEVDGDGNIDLGEIASQYLCMEII